MTVFYNIANHVGTKEGFIVLAELVAKLKDPGLDTEI